MDAFPEAFERFEHGFVDISKVKDSDDLIRLFRYWIARGTTHQQETALRVEARKRGIPIKRAIGISEKLGITREQYKRGIREPIKIFYTTHLVRGKSRTVARIPKGQKGAGRFAKRY